MVQNILQHRHLVNFKPDKSRHAEQNQGRRQIREENFPIREHDRRGHRVIPSWYIYTITSPVDEENNKKTLRDTEYRIPSYIQGGEVIYSGQRRLCESHGSST